MGLKENIAYNSLLTIANYLIPIIVFPYVSRVLGVGNLGLYNFIDSIINYYMIFSMMGISTIGVREIARNKNNYIELKKTFSSLFVLNAISTFVVLIVFIASIFFISDFTENREMFFIGGAKIFFSLFLIEWLYVGVQNFKFITIRSVVIRALYVIAVFIFVKKSEDYTIFYFLTVGSVGLNGLINWLYGRRITSFSLKIVKLKPYVKPFIILGLYRLLTSMYTTFNIVYLGVVAGEKEVGFYTTATKIQGILLSLYSAYSSVVMPHVSTLISDDKIEDVRILINKSLNSLYIFSIPIIITFITLAPQIILIISGPGYEGAILSMRIVTPLILLIGLEQILIVQLLTPLRNDKAILINSIFGAITGLILNLLLVSHLKSVGSSLVWVFSELAVFLSAHYFVTKDTKIKVNYKVLIKHLFYGIPYVLICLFISSAINNPFLSVSASLLFCSFYFIFAQVKIWKNDTVIKYLNNRWKKFI